MDYTCALCGETFPSTWSDPDAVIEYLQKFSEAERAAAGGTAVVCSECYALMMGIGAAREKQGAQ